MLSACSTRRAQPRAHSSASFISLTGDGCQAFGVCSFSVCKQPRVLSRTASCHDGGGNCPRPRARVHRTLDGGTMCLMPAAGGAAIHRFGQPGRVLRRSSSRPHPVRVCCGRGVLLPHAEEWAGDLPSASAGGHQGAPCRGPASEKIWVSKFTLCWASWRSGPRPLSCTHYRSARVASPPN